MRIPTIPAGLWKALVPLAILAGAVWLVAELGGFLAFCLRRDRQRALERGCSVEALLTRTLTRTRTLILTLTLTLIPNPNS